MKGYIAVFRRPRIQTRQYLDKNWINQSEQRKQKQKLLKNNEILLDKT